MNALSAIQKTTCPTSYNILGGAPHVFRDMLPENCTKIGFDSVSWDG